MSLGALGRVRRLQPRTYVHDDIGPSFGTGRASLSLSYRSGIAVSGLERTGPLENHPVSLNLIRNPTLQLLKIPGDTSSVMLRLGDGWIGLMRGG